MYFAVQAMAAELSTGALVMKCIKESGVRISMLVLNSDSSFTKKARGKITFTCNDGEEISRAIIQTAQDGKPQTVWMTAIGTDAAGDQVSKFRFEWTVKKKSS